MRLFVDSSVLLAASGSARGASRAIFHHAPERGWVLQASSYVIEEVLANLSNLPTGAPPTGRACGRT